MVKISYLNNIDLLTKLKEGKFYGSAYFKLNFFANKLQLKGKRENLMTLDQLKGTITLYPHQVETALKFLNEAKGRMLLADEVGLGKTIEAGIIIKELLVRDQIKRVLILTPATLQSQWQIEMAEKFGLSFEINKSVHHWSNYKKIIASIDTAKKPKHIEEIKQLDWDLLIIDEAHKLKNRRTKAYKAFQEINASNKLFLTATPLQNNLMELYNIIDLLDAGYFKTPYHFKNEFFNDNKGLEIANKEVLKKHLQEIMVRTTRREAGLEFTKRRVASTLIENSKHEEEFIDLALRFIQERYEATQGEEKRLKGVGTLHLMILARMLCSCRFAFSKSFRKYLKNNITDPLKEREGFRILELNEKLGENKKFKKTIQLVKKINSKVIIFTQFLNTQASLENRLIEEGFKVEKINGSMNLQEKKNAIRNVKRGCAEILICTESGSEGLNLQFCHNLINYDLPWNPMKLEQRIGRIHRIGQNYDVKIYNLSIKGTIEEYILQKLYKKINLFHTTIGEMADIIPRAMDEKSFEKTVFETLMTSKKVDVKKKLNKMFEEVRKSKRFQEDINKLDKKTLEVFDLSPVKNE